MAETQSTTTTSIAPRVAAVRHPLYDLFIDRWNKLADVREATGGFMDGTYLIAHPREWLDHTSLVTTRDTTTGATTTTAVSNPNPKKPSAKLKARRALASYNNLGAAIIDAFKGPLFREAPNRRVGDGAKQPNAKTPIELWWDDVFHGQSMNEMMPTWWDLGGTFGHVILYFELPSDDDALTAADQGLPKIYWYSPRDVLNWLEDADGRVIAIKVVEAVYATTFDALRPVTSYHIRMIDEIGWKLYDSKTGTLIDHGEHGLGRVPFVYLFGQRSPSYTAVGKSLLGDPQNHIDVFNLASEQRELLRGQTFSFVNVELGTGPEATSVIDAQNMMGSQTGTMNLLFTPGAATILSGDAANVEAYDKTLSAKRREIYREAGVQWEADSKDAEAQGSLQLKREDMNTRLSEMANECQTAEYELADLFYRWKYGADSGPAKLESEEVTIQYPDRFEEAPFEDLIMQITAAQTIGMPPSVLKALRKAILTKFEGMSTLPPKTLADLLEEIDNMPDDPTPQERVLQRMSLMDKAAKTGEKAPAIPPDPAKAAA